MTNTSTTTYSTPVYYLEQVVCGRRYRLDLGPFRSGMEASDAWASCPRNGSALVTEVRIAERFGVEYGLTSVTVAVAT